MLQFLYFLSIIGLAFGNHFKDCGSSEGQIISLEIFNCPDSSMICNFTRGINASITLTFSANQAINHIDVRVFGIIGGLPVPFVMPQPDACLESGLNCPVAAQSTNKYTAQVPVLQEYPNIKAGVKLQLIDSSTQALVTCALFAIQIVGADTPSPDSKPLLDSVFLKHKFGMPPLVNLFDISNEQDGSQNQNLNGMFPLRVKREARVKRPREQSLLIVKENKLPLPLVSPSKLRVSDPREILRVKPAYIQRDSHSRKGPEFSIFNK